MKRGNHLRKESIFTYLFMFVLIGISIGFLFFLDKGFTGFAIYGQANQSDFDEGIYTNTEYNGSDRLLEHILQKFLMQVLMLVGII